MERDREKPAASPQELDLQPQPKVKRLNRLAILLVAVGGILVLWTAYFVLSSRAPIGGKPAEAPSLAYTTGPEAIERLRLRALREPPEPFVQPAPVSEPGSFRYEPAPAPGSGDARVRQSLQRAYDAEVLVPAFERLAKTSPGEDTLEGLGIALAPDGSLAPEKVETEYLAADGPYAAPGPGGNEPLAPGPAADFSAANRAGDPNLLQRKDEFLQQAREEQRSTYLPATVQEPLSPYELKEGTLIPAVLATGINSDLPGQAQALVRQNVYDSTTGRYLLIPRGSRLIGEYDNRIAWGQKRVLLAWHRLIFPDGRSLDLRGMPGADLAAMAGLRDQVNNHFVRTFGSALLLSAITAGVQLSQPRESADDGAPSASQIAAAALGQEIGLTTAQVTHHNLNIQPTLDIRSGYLFNVQVTADTVLPSPYSPRSMPTLTLQGR